MFFSPTIIHLNKINIEVHILCLSNGNFYGIGNQREKEFLNSCKCLGIPFNRCHINNDPQLQ